MGISETLHFTVEAPFPTLWTAALTAIVASRAVVLLLYYRRFNKNKKLEKEQPLCR
jgi:hypothetical protein